MTITAWCFCADWNCFFAWLDKWQTLISGVSALFAAAIAAYLLWHQVKIQKNQILDERQRQNDARNRRSLALRSKMPLALDELNTYVEEAFRWAWIPKVSGSTSGSPPVLPVSAIEKLADVVEYMDNKSARYLALMLAEFQVINARMREKKNKYSVFMAQATALKWLIDAAFPYARLENDQFLPQSSMDELKHAFKSIAKSVKGWDLQLETVKTDIVFEAVTIANSIRRTANELETL